MVNIFSDKQALKNQLCYNDARELGNGMKGYGDAEAVSVGGCAEQCWRTSPQSVSRMKTLTPNSLQL